MLSNDALRAGGIERDVTLFLEPPNGFDDGVLRDLDILDPDSTEHIDLLLETLCRALRNAGVDTFAQGLAGGFHCDREIRRVDFAQHTLQIGRLQAEEILE